MNTPSDYEKTSHATSIGRAKTPHDMEKTAPRHPKQSPVSNKTMPKTG